jgi:hypothetical protein
VPASALIILVGVSGIVLVGAITLWTTVASGSRPVSRWIKLVALCGGVGVLVGATLLFAGGAMPPPDDIPLPPTAPPPGPGSPRTPNASGGAVVYSTDFNDNDGRWALSPNDKIGASDRLTVQDGELLIEVRSGGGRYVTHVELDAQQLADVEVEAVLRRIDGPADMAYGLIFRNNADLGNIYFLVNSQRQFCVFAHIQGSGGSVISLVPWTSSNLINTDQPNKLKVVAKGRVISVWANDKALSTFEYDTVFAGSSGVLLTLYGPNESARVSVDYFRVSHAAQ